MDCRQCSVVDCWLMTEVEHAKHESTLIQHDHFFYCSLKKNGAECESARKVNFAPVEISPSNQTHSFFFSDNDKNWSDEKNQNSAILHRGPYHELKSANNHEREVNIALRLEKCETKASCPCFARVRNCSAFSGSCAFRSKWFDRSFSTCIHQQYLRWIE